MNEQLLAIEAVAKFFADYTRTDINILKDRSRRFDLIWCNYVEDNTKYDSKYLLLWEVWAEKFDNGTKQIIMDYAIDLYGAEIRKANEPTPLY